MASRTARSLISLSWQSTAYGLGTLGRQAVVYLALPLFTNHMPQEEFGVVSVTAAFLAFVNTLSNAGLPAATFRLYNDTQDVKTRRLTLGSSQTLIGGYALLTALVMLLAVDPLARFLLGTSSYAHIIRVVAVLLLVESLINYGNILLRIQVRPLATSIQSVLQIVVQLGLAVLLVRRYDLGALGYWLGYLAGALVGLALMLWLVRDALVFRVSREHMKGMIVYGLPLIPAALALWALRLVDRGVVVSLAGLDEVAVYEVGYKIGMLVALVVGPFRAAWPQFAFSTMHSPHASRIYRDTLTYVAAGCTFIALGVIAFRVDLVQIMAPSTYIRAVDVVPWVALSQVAWGMYPVLAVGLNIAKRTPYITAATVFAAAVNIILNVLLIPVIGIQGAAIATLLGYTALAGGVYIMAQRFYAFPIDWSRLGKLALASGLTVLLVSQLGGLDLSLWGGRAVRSVGLLLFPILLLVTGFVTQKQCRLLWQTGTGLLRKRFQGA